MTRWLVQKNLAGHQDYVVQIAEACQETGNQFHAFTYIPFSNEFPDLPTDGSTIIYAATGPVNLAWEREIWTPGVFYTEEFKYSKYLEMLGDKMINFGPDTKIKSLKEIKEELQDAEPKDIFIRPDKDLKEFSGEVINTKDLCSWIDRIDRTDTLLKTDCKVIVSKPVGIPTEWRLFIVDEKVVTGGQYYKNGRLKVRSYKDLPKDIYKFGQQVAEQWLPCPACVVDIGMSANNLYVIEFNCINSSGFYATNVHRIVKTLSDYAEALVN